MVTPPVNPFPLVLLILDGWGESPETDHNAIHHCRPEAIEALGAAWPSTLVQASGPVVGLPAGKMGNSEAGHLCIGSGRTVYQDLSRISQAIDDGSFATNRVLRETLDGVARSGGALHLMGLVSDGGVHSHIEHLEALLRQAAAAGVGPVRVHAFTDGRDTPPQSGAGFLRRLARFLADTGAGRIATVAGRYYAMDRDQRWERIRAAYDALTGAATDIVADAAGYAETMYHRGITDEFLPAIAIGNAGEAESGRIRDGDTVLFFNFRADRARQITRAFTEKEFDRFERTARPQLARFACLTEYDRAYPLPVAIPPEHPEDIFAEQIAARGWKQIRIAETEKYAHVTFFFNGGIERSFPGEERVLIPSPRVATYDQQPQMSAAGIEAEVLRRLKTDRPDLFIVNFANADMVGHTGVYEATVTACRFLDQCVGRIATAVLDLGGTLCVTADHGNAEKMFDPAIDQPHTAHTTNPVPLILAGEAMRGRTLRRDGGLPDIVPTLMEILDLDPPGSMTGRSLLQ